LTVWRKHTPAAGLKHDADQFSPTDLRYWHRGHDLRLVRGAGRKSPEKVPGVDAASVNLATESAHITVCDLQTHEITDCP